MSQGTDSRSDEALLAAMAIGDDTAGIAFVRRYQRRAYGLALSILGDPGLAEDVAQEALVRTWRHAPAYDSRRASVATWVLTITRNLSIDALRLRRATPTDPDEMLGLCLASGEPDPADAAQHSDSVAQVRAALMLITPEQRTAVMLSAFYGLTAEEISSREGVPLGTAKTRIRSGLHKLRAALVPAESGESDGAGTGMTGEGGRGQRGMAIDVGVGRGAAGGKPGDGLWQGGTR